MCSQILGKLCLLKICSWFWGVGAWSLVAFVLPITHGVCLLSLHPHHRGSKAAAAGEVDLFTNADDRR